MPFSTVLSILTGASRSAPRPSVAAETLIWPSTKFSPRRSMSRVLQPLSLRAAGPESRPQEFRLVLASSKSRRWKSRSALTNGLPASFRRGVAAEPGVAEHAGEAVQRHGRSAQPDLAVSRHRLRQDARRIELEIDRHGETVDLPAGDRRLRLPGRIGCSPDLASAVTMSWRSGADTALMLMLSSRRSSRSRVLRMTSVPLVTVMRSTGSAVAPSGRAIVVFFGPDSWRIRSRISGSVDDRPDDGELAAFRGEPENRLR
jgi:diadenosine tetraphosphatase ApaH/serine/threonine PP2A family protein phosphatase